jgi:hypothetical protein
LEFEITGSPRALSTPVVPAKAGTQLLRPQPIEIWIPAFAGMTKVKRVRHA